MDRREIVLAALSPAKGRAFSPVQVQKLLFLIDKKAGHLVDGPHFDFQPYHYGPFDSSVYSVLERLAAEDLADIRYNGSWREYRLTPEGQEQGERILAGLPKTAGSFIRRTAEFVRSLSFQDLVRAIYKAFPEMRERSVFQD